MKSPIHSQAENADDEIIATRTAINAALEQSQLLPEDIQIMELRHGSDERVQAALGAVRSIYHFCISKSILTDKSCIQMHVTEDNSASAVSHPFIGRTGFGGMCELGMSSTPKCNTHMLPLMLIPVQCGNSADGRENDQSNEPEIACNLLLVPTAQPTLLFSVGLTVRLQRMRYSLSPL